MAKASDDQVIAQVSLTPSPLLFWLKVNLRLSEKSLSGKNPNTIFGIIPAGYNSVQYSLKQVSGVAVETKVSVPKVIFGLLFFFAGLSNILSGEFLGGFVILIIGAAIFVAGLTAALAVTNTGGVTQYIKVSLIDRSRLEDFSAQVQKAVLDRE
jgi:hypothetical protein